MLTTEQILETVRQFLTEPSFPIAERARYAAMGFAIHNPAPLPSFLPLTDWHDDSFVAVKDGEAHISLVHAIMPGQGAWTRLLARLREAKLRVVVIAPLPRFEAHLQRIGFSGPHIHGTTFEDRYEFYRDTAA